MKVASDFSLILTYVATYQQAQSIADQLLNAALIVCANIGASVESHYIWKGERCKESEIPLWIKTLPSFTAKVKDCLKTMHPYEVPVILECTMQVNEDYKRWAEESLLPFKSTASS